MKKVEFLILFVVAGLIAWTNPLNLNGFLIPQKPVNKGNINIDSISSNPNGQGPEIIIDFLKGPEHNHPLMAIWVEDSEGNYLQSLFVARSIATGIYNYGDPSTGQWTKGEKRRPAALPYWSHKRGIVADDGLFLPTPDDPLPDAYSGATPKNNFILSTKLDKSISGQFYVLLEINQPWDWNKFWTNNKYPESYEYKTSSQPAIVYRALIDQDKKEMIVSMEPIGHSHYAGENGELFEDLSTLTTALQIAGPITIRIQ